MSSPLKGKTVVVTGAASGIGAATAAYVASQGANVISIDIKPIATPTEQSFQADIGDKHSIDRLIQELPANIHGLANIAGLPPTRAAVDVIKVNLIGLKYLTEQLVPKLADGASIVNLASLAGLDWANNRESIMASATLDFDHTEAFCQTHAIAGARSYFFSKEALIVWTMQNRWTWRSRGIRMNAISPGPVDTPILKDFLETLGTRAEEDRRVMDRPGTPADVALLIAFLLADESGWIRGANIPCDGGMFSHVLCQKHGF
ncbi:MAG: coniferyl-alcohol dehydrogenase [Burkholderiaceae bacterium]|jgi:NAD(P)-dependent dehydrogenase (short-subunit alcohol dehydrogenase family)|nr:coniferyl-alcohol dehydrogenase [Burkholderiaceae bacterium]